MKQTLGRPSWIAKVQKQGITPAVLEGYLNAGWPVSAIAEDRHLDVDDVINTMKLGYPDWDRRLTHLRAWSDRIKNLQQLWLGHHLHRRPIMNVPRLSFLFIALISSSPNEANVQLYSNQSEWANSVASKGNTVVTEDFNNTELNCSLSVTTTNGHVDVATGKWMDTLFTRTNPTSSFKFKTPVYAASYLANTSSMKGGLAVHVHFLREGEYIGMVEFAGWRRPNGFLGFVSDEPFDTLEIRACYDPGDSGACYWNPPQRTIDFTIDDLTYAEAGIVSIGGVECGVPNTVAPISNAECTLQDELGFAVSGCSGGAKNHGQFVSCFTKSMNVLKKEGLLGDGDKGALTSCAAQMKIPDK